jgi:hypothetical protein
MSILDFGFWILDFGFWILDFGSRGIHGLRFIATAKAIKYSD